MKKLTVQPIKTRIFQRGEDLADFVLASVPVEAIREKMVLAVTSKIVSLAENRLIPVTDITKADLVKQEADVFLGEAGYGCFLTIKEGLFIPSAGIDESNSEDGEYILYPQDPSLSARQLWSRLRSAWNVRELGVLLTDSHTSPLRQGVTGICLSYWGFNAVHSMIGTKDLFGRELKMTKLNLADGLAAVAVMMMGEGSECQPLALVEGADVEFCEESDKNELLMPLKEDLYYPVFQNLIVDPV